MEEFKSWKIQKKLPPPLMEEEKDYCPKVVSIGPIFYGEEDLAVVESFKPIAVDLFVAGSELHDRDYYLGKILEITDEIQSFYEQNTTPKDVLAEMMLRDASLIIIYMEVLSREEIESSTRGKKTTEHKFIKMKEHLGMLTVAVLARDLFLLQNQIPLSVVKLLIYLRYAPEPGTVEGLLDRFLNKIFREEKRQKRIFSSTKKWEPLHLLEAAHTLIVSDFVRPSASPHLDMDIQKPFHSFRTVTDLKAKGIRFKAIPNKSQQCVNFKSYFFFATIQLPSWAINIHTNVLLKNMVAYELSPDSPTEGEVLSYINFMKSLIDGSEDVRVLREKRILSNMLSSDDEAAKIFNDINTYGLDNPKFFGQVEHEIQNHCKKRINVWFAELLHCYFRSPWTITAFFAALSVIGVSAGQLYYAVHPISN